MKFFPRFFASSILCLCLSPLETQGQEVQGEVLFSQDSLVETVSQRLALESYQRNTETTLYEKSGNTWVTTMVNHLTADAKIQVASSQDNLWVYLQYFTDIDGDGNYEWLADGDNFPLWDSLSTTGRIFPYGVVASPFSSGEAVSFSVIELFNLGLEAEVKRSTQGATPLSGKVYNQSGDMIFCITLADSNYLLSSQLELLPSYYFTIDLLCASERDLLGAYVFSDVTPFDWQFEAVDYVVKKGLFLGTTAETFSLEETLKRGMVLQSLYSYAGSPTTTKKVFDDVDEKDWYHLAVSWASSVGIFQGTSVRPEDPITREELVGFLYHYALQSSYYKNSLSNWKLHSDFPDGQLVTSSYTNAMIWALGNGILVGDLEGRLNPQNNATRGDASFILKNFAEIQAEVEAFQAQQQAKLTSLKESAEEITEELLELEEKMVQFLAQEGEAQDLTPKEIEAEIEALEILQEELETELLSLNSQIDELENQIKEG